ncbi:hypothetical protein [Solirubrum puertoriconensis]|uniref:Uncharacterized protein n=1 Tax=Solirubrum puertoriconensis TaxID=1751427 RepID=A0A9X0HKK3_SOLP1|nr:hypothetical protein [Solirubrum puertoriconensis]KUG07635.1 hypothetical protein ASU33_14995 [Solirubrum puertoriconensis]
MKHYGITVLVTGLLLVASCQKHDVEPANLPSADAAINNITTTCVEDQITFNNVSAGTLLGAAGSTISSTGGVTVGVRADNPHYTQANEAIVFSTNPLSSSEDNDLGTPNWVHGGTGTGDAGISGPYINNKPLGNILVLHNYKEFSVSQPNDDDFSGSVSDYGTITFDFASVGSVTAKSITVIDIEAAEKEYGRALLYNGATLLSTVVFPSTGSNGVAIVDLGSVPDVTSIEVIIGGSMGIDNLTFCATPPPSNCCTYTQGYWKNHPNNWPVSTLTLGNGTYSKDQLLEILKTPVKGNGLISLAHQLIAAKLNAANCNGTSPVTSTISQADRLIGGLVVGGSGYLSPSSTSALTDRLDRYNNGLLGTPHCGD